MNFFTFLAAPKVCLGVVDVRDVARAHMLAMNASNTDGQRVLITHEKPVWFKDIRDWLAEEFKGHGYVISPFTVPSWMVKLYAKTNLDKQSTAIVHRLGPELKFSNKKVSMQCFLLKVPPTFKSKDLMCMSYIEPKRSVLEMMYSMIGKGMICRPLLGCHQRNCRTHKVNTETSSKKKTTTK